MTQTTKTKESGARNQEALFAVSSGGEGRIRGSTQDVAVSDGDRLCNERTAQVRRSVLWAAYGDALGFISEFASEKMLNRRTRGTALDRLVAWECKVGGRGGIMVQLPAGTWSDDTQLRMAVSRAISTRGFDVEAFARIELPVWPSYALGGGIASKAAAKNLARPNTLWHANTFTRWFEAGGNGAAMRIQPHVWSSPDLDARCLLDVIADSVCTHGHLRAIVGACFHAATLAHCLRYGKIPSPMECKDITDQLCSTWSLVEGHEEIGSIWVGQWERATGKQFREEWELTLSELQTAIDRASTEADEVSDTAESYERMSERLGLTAKRQRGSRILTTAAAVVLAWIAPSVHEGLVVAANALGTDTDTIATMAGALLGACKDAGEPPEQVLDSAYLLEEADRLVAITQGREVTNHSYPDPLTWTAPRTQADALVHDDGHMVVEGLGPVTVTDEATSWTPRKDFGWQWVRTRFGQTLLVKRRPEVRALGSGNGMEPPPAPIETKRSHQAIGSATQGRERSAALQRERPLDLDRAVAYARRHIHDDGHLGYTLREVAKRGTLADLVAVVSSLRQDLRAPSVDAGRRMRSRP